jgi:hypothetical protein
LNKKTEKKEAKLLEEKTREEEQMVPPIVVDFETFAQKNVFSEPCTRPVSFGLDDYRNKTLCKVCIVFLKGKGKGKGKGKSKDEVFLF